MLSSRRLVQHLSTPWSRQARIATAGSIQGLAKIIEKVTAENVDQTPPTPPESAEPAAPPIKLTKPLTPPPIQIPSETDPTLHLFASCIMKDGKRHQATIIVSRMLVHLHSMTRSPPMPIFREAIRLASPSVRMRSQKTGGKVLLKPEALSEKQRTRAAIKGILKASYSKTGAKLEERLARELVGIVNGESGAIDQKEGVHKLAAANRSGVGIRV